MHAKNKIAILLLAAFFFALLYFDYSFPFFELLTKVLFAILLLVSFGIAIQRIGSFEGTFFGIYMVGTKSGIGAIQRLSRRYKGFLDAMALWGMFLGFGLVSYRFIRENSGRIGLWKILVPGLLSMVFISLALPALSVMTLQLIKIPQISSLLSGANPLAVSLPGLIKQYVLSYNFYALLAIAVLFGFSGIMIALLAFSTYTTLSQIWISVYKYIQVMNIPNSHYAPPLNVVPGVVPIIPGIDIPLVAGIIALVGIIAVHELSHGILANAFKIKLKSLGVVLLGLIPIGAYVEPDEKRMKKLGAAKQTKILSAGPSANFLSMIVFSVPALLIFMFVIPGIMATGVFITSVQQNYPASGVLSPGMHVLSWNGRSIANVSALAAAAAQDRPGSTVNVTTNTGSYSFTAVADPSNQSKGLIGVELSQTQSVENTAYAKSMYFAYTLFALLFALNFFIAVVNLLPVPGLDGWRIYKANIKNKKFINLLTIFIVFAIVVNILPWFFIA
ncbi:MAG: M50 family metallopeptidase [Candidatus Marsarchaeota archaeon]|nr:M50 family metallopeptidase [Candidatus Marsarchaeota archaeon]MCL5106001.1 M50 family metallopeptidase [Candidatus Marsarchaeota archaeon]